MTSSRGPTDLRALPGSRPLVPLLVAAAVSACGNQHETPRTASAEPPSGTTGRPVTVFSAPELLLSGVGLRVAPPLTPGSARDAYAITSASPDVVRIDPDGMLHTLSEGTSELRSVSGSILTVRVRASRLLHILPATLDLLAGDTRPVHAADSVEDLPDESIEWLTSDPGIVVVDRGRLRAGNVGVATVTARVGEETATARVIVRPNKALSLSLLGPSSALTGTIVQFESRSPPSVVVAWSSSDTRVLRPLANGIFHAQQPGKAQACVSAFGTSRCAQVQVSR